MTPSEVTTTADHYRGWVRVDPRKPERVLNVPDLLAGFEDMHPGEAMTFRVRQDADIASVTIIRLRDGGFVFGFQADTPTARRDSLAGSAS